MRRNERYRVFGIDLSKWQKGFDFAKAKKEGVSFVILRAMYHYTPDSCFEEFYQKAKENNIGVGCYLYSTARNTMEARIESEKLYNFIKGKHFEYPIYFDIEDKIHRGLTKSQNTEIIKTFCYYMEKKNYYVGIYSFESFFNTFTWLDKLTMYDKWIAKWYQKDNITIPHGMWQFGGETNLIRQKRVSNIKIVDQNYCYKDYPTIMKNNKLNGFNAPGDLEFHIEWRR